MSRPHSMSLRMAPTARICLFLPRTPVPMQSEAQALCADAVLNRYLRDFDRWRELTLKPIEGPSVKLSDTAAHPHAHSNRQ